MNEESKNDGSQTMIEWEVTGLPPAAQAIWEDALTQSGALETGQISMTDDGASGVTETDLFREAMGDLSGALAKGKPGSHLVIDTKTAFREPDGSMTTGTPGVTYLVGMLGSEPLRIRSGENPFIALRRAVEKSCGGFVTRQLEAAKK